MTVEEAYAAPVARKRGRNRAFVIGLAVGILAGAVAVLLLNRAAEDDDDTFEEPVVELQPALAGDGGATTRFPVTPLRSAGSMSATSTTSTTSVSTARSSGDLPPVVAAVPPVPPSGETERPT